MMKTLVIKIGGILLKNEIALNKFFQVLKTYHNKTSRFIIIVHEYQLCECCRCKNKIYNFTEKKQQHNNSCEFSSTKVYNNCYCFLHSQLLMLAKKFNINAIGLNLSDGNSTQVKSCKNFVESISDVHFMTKNFLNLLQQKNIIPVIESIGMNSLGKMIILDSDISATIFSILLDANLLFLTDVTSVLDSKGQKIEKINSKSAEYLIENNVITDGMVQKVRSALYFSKILKRNVEITSWHDEKKLEKSLLNNITGTLINYYEI